MMSPNLWMNEVMGIQEDHALIVLKDVHIVMKFLVKKLLIPIFLVNALTLFAYIALSMMQYFGEVENMNRSLFSFV